MKRRREISHQNRETTSDLENVVFNMSVTVGWQWKSTYQRTKCELLKGRLINTWPIRWCDQQERRTIFDTSDNNHQIQHLCWLLSYKIPLTPAEWRFNALHRTASLIKISSYILLDNRWIIRIQSNVSISSKHKTEYCTIQVIHMDQMMDQIHSKLMNFQNQHF